MIDATHEHKNEPIHRKMNKSTIALLEHGPNTIYTLTKLFYTKVFEDPILNVLFAEKDIEIHHLRMASFILEKCKISNEYSIQRGVACGTCKSSGQTKYTPLKEAHQKAKSCPFRDHRKRKIKRGAGVYGGPFTITQKNSWLNHFESACNELTLNVKFTNIFMSWLKFSMPKYGPFVPDRVDIKKQKINGKKKKNKKSTSRSYNDFNVKNKKNISNNSTSNNNKRTGHATTDLCNIS